MCIFWTLQNISRCIFNSVSINIYHPSLISKCLLSYYLSSLSIAGFGTRSLAYVPLNNLCFDMPVWTHASQHSDGSYTPINGGSTTISLRKIFLKRSHRQCSSVVNIYWLGKTKDNLFHSFFPKSLVNIFIMRFSENLITYVLIPWNVEIWKLQNRSLFFALFF